MWYALLLLVLAAGCAPSTRGVGVGTSGVQVEIDGDLLSLLGRIHEEFANEVAICLAGEIHGGVIHIQRLGGTMNKDATPTRVTHGGCLPPEFVGTYHNHVAGGCAFSTLDVMTAERSGHLVDLVSCGPGRFAWRLKARTGVLVHPDSL